MNILHLAITVIFIASISNNVFADDSTSTAFGGLVGFRIAEFKSDHTTYSIWYKITNGTVIGTPLDLPAKALIFMINASSNGVLTVDLPRSIIDSKNGTNDIPYYVAVDDVSNLAGRPFPVQVNEINSDNPRIIKINFTQTTKEIEIVGTYFVENYSPKIDSAYKLLSPLQQFKSGIASKDVICREGLQLMIKTSNGSPVCVKPSTAAKLSQRGWTLASYYSHTQTKSTDNPLGVTALVTYHAIDSCLGISCPSYTFYLKINSNATAYLLGYDICGSDLCAKNNTLSLLLPMNNIQIANYTNIGLSDNKKWNYGDTVDIRLEISPSKDDDKNAYFLDIKNSTIVP